jgi:hypothetical protein
MVHDAYLGAYLHQELPYEQMVARLKLDRGFTGRSLLPVEFKVQDGNWMRLAGLMRPRWRVRGSCTSTGIGSRAGSGGTKKVSPAWPARGCGASRSAQRAAAAPELRRAWGHPDRDQPVVAGAEQERPLPCLQDELPVEYVHALLEGVDVGVHGAAHVQFADAKAGVDGFFGVFVNRRPAAEAVAVPVHPSGTVSSAPAARRMVCLEDPFAAISPRTALSPGPGQPPWAGGGRGWARS